MKWAQRVQPVQMAKWVRPAQQVQQVLAEAEDCFITADVIKNALFEAAGDINEKFNSMPMTFADIWTQMGNQAMESFGGVFIQLNGLINSSGAQELLAAFSAGIDAVADGASWLISTIASGDPIVKTFFAVAIIMAGLWAAKM